MVVDRINLARRVLIIYKIASIFDRPPYLESDFLKQVVLVFGAGCIHPDCLENHTLVFFDPLFEYSFPFADQHPPDPFYFDQYRSIRSYDGDFSTGLNKRPEVRSVKKTSAQTGRPLVHEGMYTAASFVSYKWTV